MKRAMMMALLVLFLLTDGMTNPGTRHETAQALSAPAEAYYTGEYAPETLFALAGPDSQAETAVWNSPLRCALQSLMRGTLAELPSYNRTLTYFADTDASGGSTEPLRFYCDDFGPCNREQLWAEPHGAFYHEGPGQDLHHLRPADPEANLVRGTMAFGQARESEAACQVWPDTENPVFWYQTDWMGELGRVEVRDEIKGDVARILLYVYVTWGGEDGANRNLWTDQPESGAGLSSSDGLRVMESIDTLLDWMRLDPVDDWEMGRNDAVQSIQGNRNVFIDYPELAFRLFGSPIPDMPSPSGEAHSLYCTLSTAAEPPEGGSLTVEGRVVTACPNPGWVVEEGSLDPAGAAELSRSGDCFRLSPLREDCSLTVRFSLEDPCAGGHDWDQGSVTRKPGCETEGERRYCCTRCGAVSTEPIPALGHDWLSYTVGPGCERAGYTLESCRRCQAERELPGDPPLGHDWDAGTVTREPSQSCPGEQCFRCQRCGAQRLEEIPFRFLDVQDEGCYYFTPVYWALYHRPSITAGTDPLHFSPGLVCSRAQVMTFLWRAFGSPTPERQDSPFGDVTPGDYFFLPVLWAVERGISAGSGQGCFSPHAPCTRAQIVTFLWAAAGRPEPASQTLAFTDVPPQAYYRQAVLWAVEQGVTAGSSPSSFSPELPCSRAQAVTMLWRMMEA